MTFGHSSKTTTPIISRRDIDSTPVLVTKFDNPDREKLEAEFISRSGRNSPLLQNSRPVTPLLNGKITLLDIVHSTGTPETGTPETTTPSSPNCDLYVAKFNYVPMAETELALSKGQRVTVIEKAGNSWWHGLVEDNPQNHGWFPESFVEPYQPVPNQSMVQGPCRMSEFTAGSSDEVEVTGLCIDSIRTCMQHVEMCKKKYMYVFCVSCTLSVI